MNKRRLTILFSGMIAAVPHQGGATWAVLQYLLGLKQLGHDIYFVERLDSDALRPPGASLANSDNAAYFRTVVGEFGLTSHAALVLCGTHQTIGIEYDSLRQIARRADVLVNISGMLTDRALTEHIPIRAYLDLDPAFNQLWHTTQEIDMRFDGHTHFVTVGLTLGQPECDVPTCGLNWITTLQPIVLDEWRVARLIAYNALTTIANWRGYGSIEHDGIFYGQKAHSLRPFMDLPTHTREKFLLALAIHPDETKDLGALADNHWQLIDPAQVADSPAHYRDLIRHSKAEFGIAKSGYVASHCGWFSDRSACYLAAGRPVIAQETGWSAYLPTGEGLFAFETKEDVLGGIETLHDDYARHARAARALAEEYFDSDRVLTSLLERIGAGG